MTWTILNKPRRDVTLELLSFGRDKLPAKHINESLINESLVKNKFGSTIALPLRQTAYTID